MHLRIRYCEFSSIFFLMKIIVSVTVKYEFINVNAFSINIEI